MAYNIKMAEAARRHLSAGEQLYSTSRNDVAGYLFGIAAECALKQMMLSSGMRPNPEGRRRDDPFFLHFQELKSVVRDQVFGRLHTEIRRYAENTAFLQHWDVKMRYSDGRDISAAWTSRWRDDAKDIIGAMDL